MTNDDTPERRLLRQLVDGRRSRGLNQRQVAQLMGTTQSAVCDMETGRATPQLSTLLRYAAAVGLQLHVRPPGHDNPTGQMVRDMRDLAYRLRDGADALIHHADQIEHLAHQPTEGGVGQ